MKIVGADVKVVGPDVERHTWAEDLPGQIMTLTLVTIKTDEGIQGTGGVTTYTAHGVDKTVAESVREVLPLLSAANPLAREQLARKMRSRTLPILPGVVSVIDNALHDLLGQRTGLPIYQLLGGSRDRIRAYASTVMLNHPDDYLELVDSLMAQGFTAIKFHAWGNPTKDLALIRAVGTHFADAGIEFMFDAENNYDFEGALKVAKELERLHFKWFEAPLPDADINGYRDLTSRVDIPIINAGNWVLELPSMADALASHAWSSVRTDVNVCGGFTAVRKVMALAEAYGKNAELQCWGYTVSQAANLQAMLAFPNCTFFELPVPYEAFEYGMVDVLRVQRDGYVYAPDGPGLGVRIDWEAMNAATLYQYSYP